MVKGIYVPTDESEPLEQREFASLEDYQQSVGGWIEAVDVHDLGITVYVNEEGLLRHLQCNPRASFLWWYHVPGSHRAMLVGNAIIVGVPDENGDSTDVPEEVVDLLMIAREYAVAIQMGGTTAPQRVGRQAVQHLAAAHARRPELVHQRDTARGLLHGRGVGGGVPRTMGRRGQRESDIRSGASSPHADAHGLPALGRLTEHRAPVAASDRA